MEKQVSMFLEVVKSIAVIALSCGVIFLMLFGLGVFIAVLSGSDGPVVDSGFAIAVYTSKFLGSVFLGLVLWFFGCELFQSKPVWKRWVGAGFAVCAWMIAIALALSMGDVDPNGCTAGARWC